MKLLSRKKKTEPAAEAPEQNSPTPAKSKVNSLASRVLLYGFYGAMVLCLGLSGLAVVLAASTASQPAPTVEVPDTSTAEGVATSYVSAWLRATRDDQSLLEPYIGGTKIPQLPVEPLGVLDVAVAGVQRGQDPSITSVTVAAHVEQRSGAPSAPQGAEATKSLSLLEQATASPTSSASPSPSPSAASPSPAAAATTKPVSYTLRYYQVAVHEQAPGQLQVIGYPTPVPGPAHGDPVTLNYSHRVGPDTDLGKMLDGFLQAYGAGRSDVSRFLAPDYKLAAIDPAPYTRLYVQEIRTDQALDSVRPGTSVRALIQAEAELPDENGSRMAVTVPVTVQFREDRWEVTSLDPAPLIDDSTPQNTPTP
ncbi:conjugal transfer protein [Microbacterium sp. NPDC006705]|uniref:Conjugative transposon protein TcpC n=1 Tax=Micrococcus sp. MG-2010-D12 TaxID=936902 RepID=A0A0F6WFJ9_9MICC|nr:conjugal transfer protein [Micrococcus sp. MG-2010-D12]MCV7540931.1 conjugal transfer protein [Micrococcus luteus]PFH04947.1 conjugative transposon protein TcpC [Micrococcaceae bacterium JKS001869]AKF15838.1 conjugative transposon protein TcpC [Micrococcus sp. MG-2010-D12]MCV7733959.1 conjugal transfer protein [Micrococcus luteus]MCV7742832.1 conjugal transfer protein [Micrococcus luteus]